MIAHLVGGVVGQQLGGGGGGETTVYIEEDFTATTTGDLTTSNLATDEVGNGWQGDAAAFDYQGDGSGVQGGTPSGVPARAFAMVETSGREDVQVTWTAVIDRGGAAGRWQGLMVRGTAASEGDSLAFRFDGATTDPNLVISDGPTSGTGNNIIQTWDLSALLTTQPLDGDTVTLVIRCSGNNITLYSVQVNGGTVETINDTYTLTGATATTHGSGSGADWYGINTDDRNNSNTERFEYFKVESIPA